MKSTYRLAFLTTILTYLLIFTGGLVRVTGAGLGCPDWPKCFGRWIPPLSEAQLPPGIDPSLFSFPLAWIEYLNRLFGFVVGLLILAILILVIINFAKVKRILFSALLAGALVALLGWQGGKVVASELEPMLVSVHAFLAIVLGSVMIYLTQQIAYRINPQSEIESIYPGKISLWLALSWGLMIAQAAIGTKVRAAIEIVASNLPLETGRIWLTNVGPIFHVHMTLGVIAFVIALTAGIILLVKCDKISNLVWQSAWGLVILVALQLLLGFGFLAFGVPPLMEVLHLWIAALMTGLLLLMYSAVKQSGRNS